MDCLRISHVPQVGSIIRDLAVRLVQKIGIYNKTADETGTSD